MRMKNYNGSLSGYDRWKQTTPEDEDEELERRERAKAAREEAAIDALEDDYWEEP